MKKVLLLGALALTATMMMAQDDITPKGYHYYNYNGAPAIHPSGFQGANLGNATPVWSTIEGDKYFDNGLIAIGGGQYQNESSGFFNNLKAGMAIIDLGGEVGKCLTISGQNSKINEVLKELYGDAAPKVPLATGGLNWFNINWFTNPSNTPTVSAAKRIRVRVTMNMYSGALDDTNVWNNEYVVTDQGGARPEQATATAAVGKEVKLNEFIMVDEKGTPIVNDDFEMQWDPNRWLVFELDGNCPDIADGVGYNPLRLKVEFNEGGISGGTLFIRDIEFIADNEEAESGARWRSYKTLKADPSTASITDITADDGAAEYYNLQGIRVDNPSQGIYIVKQGNKVSKKHIR